MDGEITQKWITLLSSLSVEGPANLKYTDHAFETLESVLGFRLPKGYKEYCAVVGCGGFGKHGGFFRIKCPALPIPDADVLNSDHCLMGLHLDLEMATDDGKLNDDPEKAKLLKQILEKGYPFGDTQNADSFFWDTASYNSDDQSYDIYWILDEEPSLVTLVGRDFFRFIDEFCLGSSPSNRLPEDYGDTALTEQARIFTRYSVSTNDSDSLAGKYGFLADDLFNPWLYSGRKAGDPITITCSYDAPNRKWAEQLKSDWEQHADVKVKIISPGDRPEIGCLVEVAMLNRTLTPSESKEILSFMISVGDRNKCQLAGLGSGWPEF
ncbi:MAG TPA: SMI1/KNR4 family protein [Blastocatellia bacterium]|nr:SMI1/KNR4 family protein [Blastocatellia bacterium]